MIELRKLGETGYKELQQIKCTLQFARQERKVRSMKDQLVQTQNFNHKLPPIVQWN